MIRHPKIPMQPEQVPQQRIRLVVDIPPCPAGFECLVEAVDTIPDRLRPRGGPRNAIYLGQAEWAWGPGASRLDAYYLNRRRTHWLLWRRYHDDRDWPWRWVWEPYAYAKAGRVEPRTAATHLLISAWTVEAELSGLDRFHWIGEEGLLEVPEFDAIAREVWGSEEEEVVLI